jgi:hypothetical protein
MAQPPESSTQASAGPETPLHTGPPELKLIDTTEPRDVPECKELMNLYKDLFEGHKVPFEDNPVAILIDPNNDDPNNDDTNNDVPNNDVPPKIPVVLMVHWIPSRKGVESLTMICSMQIPDKQLRL